MHKEVPLSEIVDNPFQPRTTFDAATLRSLADEIKAEGFWNGTLQGRKNASGKVELVYGHRRLRALKLLRTPSVTVELLPLTDAQMALRSLEENLQREGLTDLEKADAVKRAVEIASAERKAAGKSERGVIEEIAERLGLVPKWVSTLCNISEGMPSKLREEIQAGHLTAQTAYAAKGFGGDAYVKTLAKQGKQAKADGSVPKPTHMTVKAMSKAVREAPEPVRDKLKAEIVAGDLATPQEVERRASRLASQKVRREKEAPPDLRAVIIGWTRDLKDWERKLRDVAPYMDYVDEVDSIAEPFRTALRNLITTAKDILKSAA